ncbi:MAG: phosphoribosylglycinamide formyltransferase [Firmicutes bacterium]|jgi:phosphoribosylglycinamide formyltransferase-1|nr:phosphoribosylglycinamide formyltransferase [Bacillota bacterium]
MLKIGILVSGGGTNFQAIVDAIETGNLVDTEIVTLVSSNPNAYALERAKRHNIDAVCIRKKDYDTDILYQQALIDHMKNKNVGLIVMAGFMVVIGSLFIKEFENRIINIHPSLIPSFCGNGYYGLKVHEAALKKGVKVTGATVHFVTEETDAGPIIMQKPVFILDEDTPELLQKRVMEEAEWKILPRTIQLFAHNRLKVIGNHVKIL